VPRVATLLLGYFGTEDTPYTRAVGRYTWTALAGRCAEPGVKADMVPVLIGLQGAGKTTP
jgi:predicted P-loop ATPase